MSRDVDALATDIQQQRAHPPLKIFTRDWDCRHDGLGTVRRFVRDVYQSAMFDPEVLALIENDQHIDVRIGFGVAARSRAIQHDAVKACTIDLPRFCHETMQSDPPRNE